MYVEVQVSSPKFIKLALCGDGAVGKTSLRQRYLGRGFNTSHLMTIGADFCNLEMNLNGKSTLFQVYDLAGQPNFKAIRSRFYQGCWGGILVCDLTREDTFLNLSSWIKELWKHNGRGAIPFIILGNKADLKPAVKEDRLKKYAEQLSERTMSRGFKIQHLITSAKTGLNVNLAFEIIGKTILDFQKAKDKK